MAQQSLFESSTAAETNGGFKANASQFPPKQTQCSGEDFWTILIATADRTESSLVRPLIRLTFP
ncbi:hypothetical protein N8478_00745 [bacterium]|nr:hypothetical protein [bacterium]